MTRGTLATELQTNSKGASYVGRRDFSGRIVSIVFSMEKRDTSEGIVGLGLGLPSSFKPKIAMAHMRLHFPGDLPYYLELKEPQSNLTTCNLKRILNPND